MPPCQPECGKHSRGFRPHADHAADLSCESVQIDEEEEEPERENARPQNGFPALRGCPSGCHVVLLKAISSPQRENRSSTKGMHPRFGEDERFTGEWRLWEGE